MADESLPPIEIPWRLAATTQPLSAGEPEETAISLFYFLPADEEIAAHYPDEQLVYLKATVSVSPMAFPTDTPPSAGLGEGVPCFHLRLDMKVRLADGTTGTIRPYFHAAAPLHREMLQSGIAGDDTFEGESSGQFIGKSGSQLHENLSSLSRTTSFGASAGLLGAGVSTRMSTTDVSSQRTVEQMVDTTTRQASQERRELLSHLTRVENILTLLSAKYVGTPHLSFSMSPRPLTLLSVDPSDPNLWFSQLLARRSSGIEGVQEFTALLLVPRGKDFCVEARLRRVCVLDDPPGPLTFDEYFLSLPEWERNTRMFNYLVRAYPEGTPLEEIGIEIPDTVPDDEEFIHPVREYWWYLGSNILISVISPKGRYPRSEVTRVVDLNFKQMREVWHETLIDEYERDVARSPLERGVLLGEDRILVTCFTFTAAGGLIELDSNSSVGPLMFMDIDPFDINLGGVSATASSVTSTTRERAYETVTRWNLLESRLATLMANRRRRLEREFRLDNLRVLEVMFRRWAKLPPDHPVNLSLDKVSNEFGIKDAQRKRLRGVGITNLSNLAAALLHTPAIQLYNEDVDRIRKASRAEEHEGPLPEPLTSPLTPRDREALIQQIGASLQASFKSEPKGSE